jgi:hypothetical protein
LVVERAFPLTRSRLATVAALGVVALGAGLLLWVLPALLGFAGGMTPEVASVLAADGRPPVTLRVPGTPTPLVGRALNFQRVTVAEEGPAHARAVSTLDFEGGFGEVRVSSLGRETTQFHRALTGWELEGSLAPTLVAAVAALSARRSALQAGNALALSQLLRPEDRERALADPMLQTLLVHPERNGAIQAWYLRFEAGEITVTEDAGAPVRSHRLVLVPRESGALEFVFAGSLL